MKLCIQTGSVDREYGMEYACGVFKNAGFEALDWNFDVDASPGRFDDPAYRSVLEEPWDKITAHYDPDIAVMRASGLAISQSHSPFPATVSGSVEKLDRMIPIFINSLRLCEYAGCPRTVIHGIPVHKRDGLTRETADMLNDRLYLSLIDTVRETGVMVLLENLFFGFKGSHYQGHCAVPSAAAAYIDKLNDKAGFEAFGLCFDVGHLHLYGGDMLEYLHVLGKRVKALHIHDNMGVNDDHRAPYTGNIYWPDFIQGLRDIGYDGDLDFETFAQTERSQIPQELIPAWAELIAKCGEYFRKEILK